MKGNPFVVATGTTSAFLGDERLLREFMVGDHKTRELISQGHNALMYLINDSYDALRDRQLRIAVNKDEALIRQFTPLCGRPIAEIPDPYGCHESFAEHFIQAQLTRLRKLNIHPVVMDAYRSYRNGHYATYVQTTLENYASIQNTLSKQFDSFSMKNLFRAQCGHCKCIDATHIEKVQNKTVYISCDRCSTNTTQPTDDIRGKLSWKLDCPARWNIYGIDYEAFSKSHITDLGSFDVSRFISKEFYGGQVPKPVKYGEIKITRDLSYRLIEILPPKLLKYLFTHNMERDLDLSKDSIEHFCRRFEVAPGQSYFDFVKNKLPVLAITEDKSPHFHEAKTNYSIDIKNLVRYGNNFSGLYYNKQYDMSLSGTNAISTVSKDVARAAMNIIYYAIGLRQKTDMGPTQTHAHITEYLQGLQNVNGVFPYMRKIFSQQQGPGIATLLQTLPMDYLNLKRMALGYYVGHSGDSVVEPH